MNGCLLTEFCAGFSHSPYLPSTPTLAMTVSCLIRHHLILESFGQETAALMSTVITTCLKQGCWFSSRRMDSHGGFGLKVRHA
jgi:hypothetical protein